jgi:pimeloyl-ACP methyl ester carboxylesterase
MANLHGAPMQTIVPFYREAGAGPDAVCLHANAGSSSQWRTLMDQLAAKFHVLAPDAYGAGRTPSWPHARKITLSDEVELLEPVFARAREPFALVGHSHGAAVALIAALRHPQRVRALALYEPTLFSLIDAHTPSPNDADTIREVLARATADLAAGKPDLAAQRFVDYWMGYGAWAFTPEARRAPILASIGNIEGWGHALLTEPTPLAAFKTLDVPVLYIAGKRSPASSRSVMRLLAPVLPRATLVEFEKLGHMAPMTHPAVVNIAIADFLEQHMPMA